jgi:lipoprotein-anchoring transpeptidase ErfK/SrfK
VSRAARIIAGVVTVLVFAAIGLAARAVLDDGGAKAPPSPSASSTMGARGAPPKPVASGGSFSADAAVADPASASSALVAHAKARSVLAYPRAGGKGRAIRVHALRVEGKAAPLVFAVDKRQGAWVRVAVGRRPNGSKVWLRGADVTLSSTAYRVEVQLSKHRLIAWKGERAIVRAHIAVGKALSPTPKGRYFIADLIKPRNPRGFYGPYAFGLSAYSSVYTSFAGGDGQIGIHGTNAPGAIGSDVSHGCIRLRNAVIAKLARRVPLGSPVEIAR